jgi:hypothetical protein
MDDYPKVEMLSSEERELLTKDMAASLIAIRYGKFIIPVTFLFAFLSWYCNWVDVLKFLTTVFSIAAFFSVVAAFFQIRHFRQDLKENLKKTVRVELLEKFAEGYVNSRISMKHNDKVRRRIKVHDSELQAAIAYKKANQQNTNNFFKQSDDAYDELLGYNYSFRFKTLGGEKIKTISVPVEFYLVGKAGATVSVTTAVHSKKILKIEE